MTLKRYPRLYARNVTGSIQVWFIELDENRGAYRSVSGQMDGAKVISEFTQAKPKNIGRANATTALEQAEKEIEAKYKKNIKLGYFERLEDIDNQTFFQPMLAKSYGDYKNKIDWTKGVGVQIKFNGVRCIATKNGLFSRKGEPFVSVPHIWENLRPYFKTYPTLVLDGELYNYDRREKLNEIMELCRKSIHATPEDLARSKELIKYYVYDGGRPEELNSGYPRRKGFIDTLLVGNSVIGYVDTFRCYSESELDRLYQRFLADKQEGAILRIFDQPYENKRTKNLLKYKPIQDDEFPIIDVIEGEGNRSGMAGKVICQMKDGRTFGASMKGTTEQFKEVFLNKSNYIGQKATIFFFGFTGKGLPNYAQFDCDNWKNDK